VLVLDAAMVLLMLLSLSSVVEFDTGRVVVGALEETDVVVAVAVVAADDLDAFEVEEGLGYCCRCW